MVIGGPTITLSNGTKMPQVGLGTWQSKPEEVKAAVKTAVEAGYRLIDTATCYENENAIGDAVKELIQEGKVSREELFITTKLWLTHLHPDDTENGIRESLDRLQLDYVDLYLAHFPTCFNHDMTEQNPSVTVQDIWRGLEGVYKKGLTKAIGVSNWNGEQIERVLKTASVPIHNLQVELYLYWPQHELHEVCKKHNISLTSYGSLGSPGRVNFSLPSGAKLVWASAPNPFDDENVKNLAKKYSKTPAQILLRYLMDRNIAVIPKSVNPSRIVENFQIFYCLQLEIISCFHVFDFALTAEEMKLLESSKHRQRLFTQDFLLDFKHMHYLSLLHATPLTVIVTDIPPRIGYLTLQIAGSYELKKAVGSISRSWKVIRKTHSLPKGNTNQFFNSMLSKHIATTS